jgi:hypothetical protein
VSTVTVDRTQCRFWLARLDVAAVAAAGGGALGAGDGGDAGGLGRGRLHGLGGDREAPGEDDQGDEEHERGQAHRGLDGGGPGLAVAPHPVILSTGTAADWVIVGRHPGMTLSATPRTVTDAVVAVRVPVTVGLVRASPPVSVT